MSDAKHQPEEPGKPNADADYLRRLLLTVLVLALVLFAWTARSVLLLIFASILIATLIRSLSEPLQARTPVGERAAVLLSAAFIVGVVALGSWLFGRQVSEEISTLTRTLPQAWAELEAQLMKLPGAPEIAARLRLVTGDGIPGGVSNLVQRAGGFVSAIGTAAVHLLLVIAAGLYLAMSPRSYRDGLLRLTPKRARGDLKDAMDASGEALKRWLLGQLALMVIVGTLVALGAWLIGLPSALALGLFAGLTEFVPFVGPILGAIPGLLLGFSVGLETGLWSLLLYVGVQQVEGYVLTPLIQRQAVHLPPVITLFAVVALGLVFGPMGLLLATPLAVVALVLTKRLYIEGVLRDDLQGEVLKDS